MSDTDYFGLMIITASTVAKIMLCAMAGMFASRYFSARELSEKGLSYISVQVFLPCLLFSNLCLNVTMDDVKRYYWAPILACIPVALGLGGALLMSPCNAEKYRGLLLLGSSFQNGLTFPLSIVVNLKGIAWFGEKEAIEAQRYLFLYNIICSIGLWAIGDPLIAYYKSRDDARLTAERRSEALAERHVHEDEQLVNRSFDFPYTLPKHTADAEREKMSPRAAQRSEDDALPGAPAPRSPTATGTRMASESPRKRTATTHEQLRWYQPPAEGDLPISPVRASPTGAGTRHRKSKGHGEQIEDEPVDVNELSEKLHFSQEQMVLPPGLTAVTSADAGGDGDGNNNNNEDGDRRDTESDAEDKPKRHYGAIILRAVQSRPVFVSLLALVISLVPPLRWCAETFPGKMLLGGFSIVGSGAIPLQLLVLGCNVVSSRPKPVEAEPAAAPRQDADTAATTAATNANTSSSTSAVAVADGAAGGAAAGAVAAAADGEAGDGPRAGCLSCLSMENMFMACSIGIRMFCIPCISFLIIHLLRVAGVLPNERPFLLAMLVAVNSPSAINSALICSMHDYHARVYSQMIFFMYMTSIFTATIGLFFFILYLN